VVTRDGDVKVAWSHDDIVDHWVSERRGLNKHTDPWTGASYLDRECGCSDEWKDEKLRYKRIAI